MGSVLYIAAHPDDENTGLIAYLANEKLVRTGYLSLTRGDGGQNLIGTEQREQLGLIRTHELLQARRIDGGEQFFTRANDFGFSKSAEESFLIWGRDSILSDMVWVIRKFRPDVIITRFPTSDYSGHGHHHASALLAEEAFKAAADPKRFPDQLRHVETWQAKRLMFNASRWWKPNLEEIFKGNDSILKADVGTYNPLLGKSYTEVAAASRSMHKSQGFGTSPNRGSQTEYLKHLAGEKPKADILDGINLSWSRKSRQTAAGSLQEF
jgi:LmbE family N-acetylglucosaminyl deacetylase